MFTGPIIQARVLRPSGSRAHCLIMHHAGLDLNSRGRGQRAGSHSLTTVSWRMQDAPMRLPPYACMAEAE